MSDPGLRDTTSAGGDLEVVLNGRRRVVPPTGPFVIGRGDDVDLDVPHRMVSRRHLVLRPGVTGWTLIDHSSNGTFVGDRRITDLLLQSPTTIALGSPSTGAVIQLLPVNPPATDSADVAPGGTTISRQGQFSAMHQLTMAGVSIGRLPDNDVVLDDLLVSRRHALLRRTPAGWTLRDQDSGNGTFVNGDRITEAAITPGDVIGIGRALLQLDGNRLVTYVDIGGNSFEADGLTVTTNKGKTLLHAVSFALPPRTLLAVIGPSGAGKSTLLNALIGAGRGESGHGPVRRTRPLPGLRRTAAPHCPRSTGRCPAHRTDGPAGPVLCRAAAFPGRHHARGPLAAGR